MTHNKCNIDAHWGRRNNYVQSYTDWMRMQNNQRKLEFII